MEHESEASRDSASNIGPDVRRWPSYLECGVSIRVAWLRADATGQGGGAAAQDGCGGAGYRVARQDRVAAQDRVARREDRVAALDRVAQQGGVPKRSVQAARRARTHAGGRDGRLNRGTRDG